MTFGQPSERGAVAITVALSLVLLVGMIALALDGGLAYNERRSTQNAADHAALAAAWAKCQGATDAAAQQAGRDSALLNGYDGSVADIDVTVTRITGTTGTYEAVISSTKAAQFGGAIGQPEVTVLSTAIADCSRRIWGGGYALFADGPPACGAGFELDFTGGGMYIDGGVHSNGDLRLNGNNGNPSTITELTTYVGSQSYNGMIFAGGHEQSPPQPDPFGITYDQYLPANNTARWGVDYFHHPSGGTINAKWLEDNGYVDKVGSDLIFKRSGVYFTTGDIGNISVAMGTDINTGQPTRITLVAGGQIHLTGQSSATHYDPNGVVMFSNHQPPPSCSSASNNAIQWSLSSGSWTGLIYAPNGEVSMSLSSGTSMNGAIFGYSVDVSGSNFQVTYLDITGGGPEYEVEMFH